MFLWFIPLFEINMEIPAYLTIQSPTIKELEITVCDYINKGYIPLGNVTISNLSYGSVTIITFYQSMVLKVVM